MKSRSRIGALGFMIPIAAVLVGACGTPDTSGGSAASSGSTSTVPSSRIAGFRSGPPPVSPLPSCPAHQTQPSMSTGTFCGPTPSRGAGLGPAGECTGRETTPPCGPGMVAGRYYAYTLPGRCDGRLILDGRRWRSELPPPKLVPDMFVWVSVARDNQHAGFISPRGTVSFDPDYGQPVSACLDSP
jgi:hypothetical protein